MAGGSADQWNKGVYLAIRTLLHFMGAVIFWYGIYYDFSFVRMPMEFRKIGYEYGGKLKFLTVNNAIIQACYFTICLINDFIGTNEVTNRKLPIIRRLKDYIMAAFAFPLAIYVGVSFWTLYAIDRELVFPKIFDTFFPNWLNHVMHTNIVVFIILEMCTSFRQYPSRENGLTGLTLFMGAYLIWVHIIKYNSGLWVYPVLEVLNFPQRLLFFTLMLLFCLALYFVGEFFNNKIWTVELKQLKVAKGKNK